MTNKPEHSKELQHKQSEPDLFFKKLKQLNQKVSEVQELSSQLETWYSRLDRSILEQDEIKILKTANGDIRIDILQHKVTVKHQEIGLRRKAFDLLCLFLKRKNILLKREFICEYVWNQEYYGTTKVVDNTVSNLRKKLRKPFVKRIKTYWGEGYKFVDFK
jgi:DNA-binding response OmpR family regulator